MQHIYQEGLDVATRSTQSEYGTIAVGMHWASAALVLVQVVLGFAMTRIGDGDTDSMYRIHVGIGLLIALLTLSRVAWRVVEPSPATPPMPEWRRRLYVANHVGFYVALGLLATTGIAMLVASDVTPLPTSVDAGSVEDGRPRDAHFALSLVFSALFFMHVIGVVTYQRTKGEVFSRMGVTGLPSPNSHPSASEAR